jgi:OOP family OmpA-OmpF porin
MIKYPDLNIRINGYTDALGSDKYNLKLSLLRAESVKAFFEGKLGMLNRINVFGFGEMNPVALNADPDGKDNPEGRRFNRRTEIAFDNIPGSLIIVKIIDVPEALLLK